MQGFTTDKRAVGACRFGATLPSSTALPLTPHPSPPCVPAGLAVIHPYAPYSGLHSAITKRKGCVEICAQRVPCTQRSSGPQATGTHHSSSIPSPPSGHMHTRGTRIASLHSSALGLGHRAGEGYKHSQARHLSEEALGRPRATCLMQ